MPTITRTAGGVLTLPSIERKRVDAIRGGVSGERGRGRAGSYGSCGESSAFLTWI